VSVQDEIDLMSLCAAWKAAQLKGKVVDGLGENCLWNLFRFM
jgi:hypothetical protein